MLNAGKDIRFYPFFRLNLGRNCVTLKGTGWLATACFPTMRRPLFLPVEIRFLHENAPSHHGKGVAFYTDCRRRASDFVNSMPSSGGNFMLFHPYQAIRVVVVIIMHVLQIVNMGRKRMGKCNYSANDFVIKASLKIFEKS
jgi:hypothetical protein